MPLHEIVDLRSDLITASVRSFRPHLVLVDHAPTGAGDELLPVLRRLRHETLNAQIVLGMRDIIDAPHRVRAQMSRKGTVDVLRQAYDEILVYGERSVLDVAEAYALPQDVADRVRYVGFASRPLRGESRRNRAPGIPPQILATAGGGGDGYRPLRSVIAAIRGPLRDRDLKATIVTGPLMPADDVAALRLAAGHDARIDLRVTVDAMPERMASADLLVGMGGYNTVYEALSIGCRFLALPRCHPRLEQLERCRRLEELGLLHAVSEDDASDPNSLADAMTSAIDAPARDCSQTKLRFDGAERAAECLLDRLEMHGHPARSQTTHAGQR
jgi:predicted glycosyltransferase